MLPRPVSRLHGCSRHPASDAVIAPSRRIESSCIPSPLPKPFVLSGIHILNPFASACKSSRIYATGAQAGAADDGFNHKSSVSNAVDNSLGLSRLDREIADIALPMLAALAADPIAGIIDTALVGRLGAVELAGMGVGLSIFNTMTKFFNVPLLSATTTAVAEAVGKSEAEARKAAASLSTNSAPASATNTGHQARALEAEEERGQPGVSASTSHEQPETSDNSSQATLAGTSVVQSTSITSASTTLGKGNEAILPSESSTDNPERTNQPQSHVLQSQSDKHDDGICSAASSAILIALLVGIVEAALLCVHGGGAANAWGLPSGSAALQEATKFLQIRSIAAPFTVLFLTLQGVYRGLGDTKTSLAASLMANIFNIVLAPVFILAFQMGVAGAALAAGVAQVFPTMYLLLKLRKRVSIKIDPGAVKHLFELLKPSGFLLLRTASVTATYAFATSALARAGADCAAAHQVAFTLWLAVTLLADALAVAAQNLLARNSAAGNMTGALQAAERCVQLSGLLGLLTGGIMIVLKEPIARAFTQDPAVLSNLMVIMPILILTQPINMLAFVWDGVLFGAKGFKYASVAMFCSAIPSCALIFMARQAGSGMASLQWVWMGLSMLMFMRMVSIWAPYHFRVGPFSKLRAA